MKATRVTQELRVKHPNVATVQTLSSDFVQNIHLCANLHILSHFAFNLATSIFSVCCALPNKNESKVSEEVY